MFYHIVNYHHINNGYDDGADCKMFNEAKAEARKSLLVDNPNFMYCEKVFITTPMGYLRPAVFWVFDKDNLNGRRPHKWEIEQMIAENYREEYLQNSPYIEKKEYDPPAGSVILYRSKEYWKSSAVKKMKREEKLLQLERAERTARELKDGGEMTSHVFGATMRWINQERKKLVA